MAGYLIPESPFETELIIKKSRFITHVTHVESRTEAMSFLEQLRARYPDARHHCWAYLLGNPEAPSSVAMSDDGEPSGTAGKPILNVMQHKNVGDIMVVVVRYFGGIKLGAGGLVRAYSGATQRAYDALPTDLKENKTSIRLSCGFEDEQRVRLIGERHQAHIGDTAYTSSVQLKIEVNEDRLKDFLEEIGNIRSANIVSSD